MNPDEYSDFQGNRTILVMPTTVIDIETGRVFARTQLLLAGSVPDADTQFRLANKYSGRAYVLRIPAECVDRSQLESAGDNCWHYRRSITVAHCGIEQIDLDKTLA